MRDLKKIWWSSHTLLRRLKRMDWDGQMSDLKTIEQVHILSWDGWRGWDGMIKWKILKQLTKLTYELETDEEDGMIRWEILNSSPSSHTSWRQMKMGLDDQMRDFKIIDQVHALPGNRWRWWEGMIRWEILYKKQLTKFTYFLRLETDEEDGGWSDERSWNNQPSLHMSWTQMKKMG